MAGAEMIKVTIDKREGMNPIQINFGYGLPVKSITVSSAFKLKNDLHRALDKLENIKVENFLSGGMTE